MRAYYKIMLLLWCMVWAYIITNAEPLLISFGVL